MVLYEMMKPYVAGYDMAERMYYDRWMSKSKNRRRMVSINKVSKIRKVVRGKLDKYGR